MGGSNKFLWEEAGRRGISRYDTVGQKGPPTRKVPRSERKTPLSEVLPAGIVAQLDELGQALVQAARAHRDETLATLEQETLTTIRAAMPGLLAAVLGLSTTSLQPGGGGTDRALSRLWGAGTGGGVAIT